MPDPTDTLGPLAVQLHAVVDGIRAQLAESEADNLRLRKLLRSQSADADTLERQRETATRSLAVTKAAHRSAVAKLERARGDLAAAAALVLELREVASILADRPDYAEGRFLERVAGAITDADGWRQRYIAERDRRVEIRVVAGGLAEFGEVVGG